VSSQAPGRILVLALLALASAALLVAAAGGETTGPETTRAEAAAWEGLVGEPRPAVDVGQRVLVVLDVKSLADRVREAGGAAGDREERRWTREARAAQRFFLAQMAIRGAPIRPEHSYVRVLNGFAAALDPRAIALLERSPAVEGIYRVHAAYPAAVSSRLLGRGPFGPGMGRRPEASLPGVDGRGVFVALLDTGVDRAHPYLRGRVQPGVDLVDGEESALPKPHPDNALELERHGTQLAGILVGAGGPSGLAGVATGATVFPIRVAGWQRDAEGAWQVFARTDQVIAGLERAVDPNDDDVAHDAARIALVGVVEPFSAFATGPLARAAAGAHALGTLVVAPGGNDGPAGPGFGKVAGPGGAPAALAVGAADLRRGQERSRVVLRAGLTVLHDRLVPLGGGAAPEGALDLAVGTPALFDPAAPPEEQADLLALGDFFDENGFSRVAGRAALVPVGADTARVVRDAARAGAAAVVTYGSPLPAGAIGVDERVPVPVVGVPAEAARALLQAVADGADTGISIGSARAGRSPTGRAIAPFSSRGLAFDGRVKPELVAAGVSLATSEPGSNEDGTPRFGTINGSSAAAAVAAGAAALLAQARPSLGPTELKSLLVGSATPLQDVSVVAQGAGILDVGAAAVGEVSADPAALAFRRASRPGWDETREVEVRNVSTRNLRVGTRIARYGFPAAPALVTARPRLLFLRPGASATVRVRVRVPAPARGGPPAEGALELRTPGGGKARVPFAIAFAPPREPLLSEVALTQRRFRPSDARPSVLSIVAGRVRTVGGTDEVHPLERLDIELYTGDRKRIGVIARLRNVLPGRYAFGITGRDSAGTRLEPGVYRVRVVAWPAGGGPATRRALLFTVT
jgi:minor extracellular serine protease Vpr